MSNDLLRKLRILEEDYLGVPPAIQQGDLQEINQLRSQLGMPLVDARLSEIRAAVVEDDAEEKVKPASREGDDHDEAREAYQAYLKKKAELEPHRTYAEQIARATEGFGKTPVRPLATMGSGGGPLLCDYCGKPFVLEGGRFHGTAADEAWKKNPQDGWTSWILGGMVVEFETNGALRVYHGYPHRKAKDCCNIASREDEQARAEFDASKRPSKWPKILAFIKHEFPDMTTEGQTDLMNNMLDTLYEYDQGIGVNRPGAEG